MAQLKLGTTIAGNTAWHSGNDGTGSGLDADLLDGLDSLHYLNYNNLTNKPTVWPITGTDGQMVYINDGVATSSPLVFYDDVNQRLGIGTNTPTARLNLAETWNNVATTFTHIKSNVTDTASAASSLLMDLQVGSLSKFRVGKDAQVSAGSFMIGFSPESTTTMSGLSRNGNNLLVTTVGTQAFNFGTGAFISARPIAIGPDAYTADVVLNRDAANILAQRNGINTQTLRVYNTYTDASNYERLAINNDGSSYFQLETQHAGTGTAKDIALRPNSTLKVQNASGGAQIYLQPGAGVGPIISSNSQLNLQSGTNSTIRFAQGSALTTNTTPFKFETTYNDAATTYRGIAFDLTDTASGSTSRLLDFKVGTEDIFSVRKDGGFGIDQFRILPSTSLYGRVLFSGAERVRIGSSFVELNSSGHFSWSSTGNPGSADTFIYRDAANTIAQRNGINAQTSRIYNTFTDASNYEHAKIGWNTNVLEIGTVAAGTGTLRNINLIGGNVGIGTSSPAFKLHLYEATANPQIRIQNGSTGAIDITPTSINSGQHLAISASSYVLLASTTNDIIHRAVMSHKFENNSGSEWMRITATGNVGIGTAAPGYKLHVVGSAGYFDSGLRLGGGYSAIDVATGVSGLYLSGSQGALNHIFISSTGNLGIGGVSPSAKLDVAGDIEVNSNVNLNSEATTLATVTKTQVASFPVASFRSGKLIVQAYDSVTGEVQISELLVAHNGTTASATEYGVVFTGTTSMVIYDVDISAGNVRLLATRTTANSTQYKTSETLMVA